MPSSSHFPRRTAFLAPLGLVLVLLAVLFLTTVFSEEKESFSVLLLTPDSLRVDRLPPFARDPEAPPTPNLQRLAERGTIYTNAWATAPWTAPSIVSVMTGHYPPAHGVVYRDDTTPPGLPTLPRILEGRDYEIGNFSFFSEISYFRNLGLGPPESGLHHQNVAETFVRWLGEVPPETPFFAWVHLLETHLPYGATGYRAPAAEVAGSTGLETSQVQGTVPVGSVEFAEGDREALLELYDRDVEAMDEAVGRVLDALEDAGRLESTVIVFVADHGEELLDRGVGESWVGHASTAVEAHLYPEITRVPLLVAGPGVPAGVRRHEPVQQVDILPTLARLAAFETPPQISSHRLPGLAGRWHDLFDGARRHVFFDSSPGGNLTPQNRRGERLQGVSDGVCLVSARIVPGAEEEVSSWRLATWPDAPESCSKGQEGELLAALESWRREQARLRMQLLRAGPERPEAEDVESWPVTIWIREPRERTLRWGPDEPGDAATGTGGQIALEWEGNGSTYWIEYRLGEGTAAVSGLVDAFVDGAFYVEQERVVFGPVPRGFWNDLALYSPFEIRIVDAENEERSKWIEFAVQKTR